MSTDELAIYASWVGLAIVGILSMVPFVFMG
jgi:hypothetical protein